MIALVTISVENGTSKFASRRAKKVIFLVREIIDFYSMVLSPWNNLRVSKKLFPDVTILLFGRPGADLVFRGNISTQLL